MFLQTSVDENYVPALQVVNIASVQIIVLAVIIINKLRETMKLW